MIPAAAKRVGVLPLYTFDHKLAREEGSALRCPSESIVRGTERG